MADWKDEARGIPVWEGAKAIHTGINRWPQVVALDPSLGVYAREPFESSLSTGFAGKEELILDLSDPDTQAAYLRRLALRLGCPEEVAGEGVIATFCGGGLQLRAGAARRSPYNVWTETVDVGTDDRLLALVRAWTSA